MLETEARRQADVFRVAIHRTIGFMVGMPIAFGALGLVLEPKLATFWLSDAGIAILLICTLALVLGSVLAIKRIGRPNLDNATTSEEVVNEIQRWGYQAQLRQIPLVAFVFLQVFLVVVLVPLLYLALLAAQ